jgi:hypothetical protein
MTLEAVDAVCGASAVGFESFEEKEESTSTHFHKSIFSPPLYPVRLENEIAVEFETEESSKTDETVSNKLGNKTTGDESNNKSKFNFKMDFGPGGNFVMTGTVTQITPDGNFIEGTVTYNSDGTGAFNVGGGTYDEAQQN